MDTRTTSADFYPGGKTPVTAGGGITSGEAGGSAGEPMVPVTKVEQLPEHYRESDMRSKINELARVISGGVAAIMAMVSLTLGAEPVKVLGAKKNTLWNDDFVVTNVVVDFAGFATTNTVTGATNALAATFVRGLEVATNAVVKAGAKEIAAATNALSQSVDARLKASTNGSFSASSLEPYAKRTWVEAQGYLKSTNLTGYAQVNWVQNQGYIKKEKASGEITRIVDEKIAAQDKTAAYRLMAVDGSKWIDGTGVCWEVTSHVRIDGEELSSKGIVQEWQKVDEGTEKRMSYSDENGLRNWAYSKILKWRNDPDDPNSTEEFVEYLYNGSTNLTAGTVVLKLEGEDNPPDQNGTYPPETVTIEYWLTTNIVTRLATTNDMPKIDFTLTTNDVCAIVTNEVVEVGDWKVYVNGEYKPGWSARIDTWEADEQMAALCITENGSYLLELTSGTAAELTSWTEYSCSIDYVDSSALDYLIGSTIRVKKERIIRNALGLAMAKDLEKLPDHETVTNVARSVVNSVWDASLGVAWEARMHNGHLYYIAVTNKPPEVK